jgi:hypothetical protein
MAEARWRQNWNAVETPGLEVEMSKTRSKSRQERSLCGDAAGRIGTLARLRGRAAARRLAARSERD